MMTNFLDLVSDDRNLVIETARLTLEPVVEDHAPKMLPLLLDEALYIYVPQDPPNLDELRRRYKLWGTRKSPDGSEIWLNWMARERATGECIGHFQAGYDHKNGFSVAYTVGRTFQRRGYATESLGGVVNFLRSKMNAQSVKAWVDTRNLASIRLLRGLGFVQVQVIEDADEFKGTKSDEFVFELTNSAIRPLTVNTWNDFVSLMGTDAQCTECWCLNHRMPAGCPTGAAAQGKMKELTAEQKVHGLLAFEAQECVGWVGIDPMGALGGHDCQATGKEHEWSIHCLFVKEGFRGKGVSGLLIQSAVAFAKGKGARLISAFPIPEINRERFPAHEAEFSGRYSTYAKLGFRPAGDGSDFYQRMELAEKF